MSLLFDTSSYDYAGLARELKTARAFNGETLLINELLLDVHAWRKLDSGELERRLAADPVACAAAWELTYSGEPLYVPSDTEYLRQFRRRDFLKHLIYLGVSGLGDDRLEVPRVSILPRRRTKDVLAFIHAVMRWAQRFAHWTRGDRRELMRINLQYPFAVAVLDAPETTEDMLVEQILTALGIRLLRRDARVPVHQLADWLVDELELETTKPVAKQRQLDFRQSGGTQNSLFVVRAMGGVDGFDVRGNVGEDLGLIIDIGDREVSMAATAYLERHVVNTINQRTAISAEIGPEGLVLRWYDTRLEAEDLGRMLYDVLKQEFTLSIISVNLLFDPIRIGSLKPSIFAYREDRAKKLQRRSEENEPFILCRSCASYAPHAFCIVSVDRPPCCHRSYDELAALARFTPGSSQVTIDNGVCRDRTRGRYMGVDKIARHFSEGHVPSINLHSISDNPHPATALVECVVWYLDELDVLCVVSQDYTGRSPDGKTYESLLARVAGQQLSGFLGVSEAYLALPRFLSGEGGLARVGWMNSALKGRLHLDGQQIATEKDCINMAGLKEYLAAWRHR
ncbi:hypothetical protein JW859_01160 [bacterium]|nr:hypothetical protein [bacterium]